MRTAAGKRGRNQPSASRSSGGGIASIQVPTEATLLPYPARITRIPPTRDGPAALRIGDLGNAAALRSVALRDTEFQAACRRSQGAGANFRDERETEFQRSRVNGVIENI